MATKDSKPGAPRTPPSLGNLVLWVLAGILLLWAWQDVIVRQVYTTIPYSEFKQRVSQHRVSECEIRQEEIVGRIVPAGTKLHPIPSSSPSPSAKASPTAKPSKPKGFLFRTVRVSDPTLVRDLEKAGTKFVGVHPGFLTEFLSSWVLPLLLLFGLWIFLSRRMGSAGQAMMSIGKSKARLVADQDTGVRFDDVAGCEEAKSEMQEVVKFLQEPQRFTALGAKIPKGVLLVGPPGTGKTLLARAVAGEAGVPFFQLSGSDFVEMFVGVGAARVRDLFDQAKSHAPCIVFIDELDAIGRERGIQVGTANDEREQTLNQLLVEMDGFQPNAGVILMAATNRPEVLDRALLRPGRFDRQIVLDAPDVTGRLSILQVHSFGKPLSSDVDLRQIAQVTPGFSGADLANTVNEAALLAARQGHVTITQADLEEAVEKVVAGPERRSRRMSTTIKQRVAYHETGHALVAFYSEHADPVHKISIVPRGHAALGYTMQLPEEDQYLLTRSELLDRMKGMRGGRAAEEVVYGEVSTGAENDLERATALARQMVGRYGMSQTVGLVHCAPPRSLFLKGVEDPTRRACSDETANQVDVEVRKLLDAAYSEALQTLTRRRAQLESVARELMQRETLDAEEFKSLLAES